MYFVSGFLLAVLGIRWYVYESL